MRLLVCSAVVILILVSLTLMAGDSPMGPASGAEGDPPTLAIGDMDEKPLDLWTNMSIRFSPGDSLYIEDVVSFIWDFGDGSEPIIQTYPLHVYRDPGTYTVNLTLIFTDDRTSMSSLTLSVQRDHGDTEAVIKAVDSRRWGTFLDPDPDMWEQVAVRRGGWVAYMCEFGDNQVIEVDITIIGDRPVDIYLFDYFNFKNYKNNSQLPYVPFEQQGSEQNVTGEFGYSFTAPPGPGIYFIIIDNRDKPNGTYTKGPVDYTISIESRPIEQEVPNWWEEHFGSIWPIIGLVIVPVAMLITIFLLRERRGSDDRRP